jgi:hypothetical protein
MKWLSGFLLCELVDMTRLRGHLAVHFEVDVDHSLEWISPDQKDRHGAHDRVLRETRPKMLK